MQKYGVILGLFVFLGGLGETEEINPAAVKGGLTLLNKLFGETIHNTRVKIEDNIAISVGDDISVGDVDTMNVSLIRSIEPFANHVVVTDFLSNRAGHLGKDLRPVNFIGTSQQKIEKNPKYQSVLNEIAGIYMVLNESESVAAETLLSSQPCLLSNEDYYFLRAPNPCKYVADQIYDKILERFDRIQSFRMRLTPSIQVPDECDAHWRYIVLRLDHFAENVLGKKKLLKWKKIKEFSEKLES
jgi:hypothetical protein